MKILIVQHIISGTAGANRQMIYAINAFLQNGHQVTFINGKIDPHLKLILDPRVNLIHVPLEIEKRERIKKIRKIIAGLDFDFAYIMGDFGPFVRPPFRKKIPYVVRTTNKTIRTGIRGFIGEIINLFRYRIRSLSHAAMLTIYNCDEIAMDAPKRIKHKIVAPSFIDLSHIKRKLEYRPIKKILLIGRYVYQKNYPLAMKALDLVKREYPNIEAYAYAALTPTQEQEVKDFLAKNNLLETITFLKPIPNLGEVIADYDLYLITSRFEGFPSSLAEAMYAGLPCVAVDFQYGSKDALGANERGIICASNENDIARAIKVMIENPTLAEAYGRKASDFIAKTRSKEEYLKNSELIVDTMARLLKKKK
jgi:glycosyltransferase involved in cell wall biosynthesis